MPGPSASSLGTLSKQPSVPWCMDEVIGGNWIWSMRSSIGWRCFSEWVVSYFCSSPYEASSSLLAFQQADVRTYRSCYAVGRRSYTICPDPDDRLAARRACRSLVALWRIAYPVACFVVFLLKTTCTAPPYWTSLSSGPASSPSCTSTQVSR